jgi:lipoprotein-releasing system permease protein
MALRSLIWMFDLNTEILIAWRYIKARRCEKFISAMAAFSLAGIILGVATLIIVTSVMNGFRKEFTDRIIGFNGHISLNTIDRFEKYEDAAKFISEIPGVKSATPIIERHAMISNAKFVKGTLCHGISCENLGKNELISQNIIDGNIKDFEQEDAIILGDTLAKRMGLGIGDDVTMIVPEIDETGFGFIPRKKTFKLVATFKSGMHEYDISVSFISLKMSQKLFKLHKTISTISIFVEKPLEISNIKKIIVDKFFADFKVTDWQSSNSAFMKAVEIERNVMFLILTLITLVASFNIISCMIMLVKDKEKDIAILRTIGMAKSSITRIFFMVGASIGMGGTVIGVICGLAFSMNIRKIQAFLESMLSAKLFSPEVYFLTHLPSLLRPTDVIITVVVSFLLSCISTLYPAKRAGKLNPVEILRHV